MPYYCSLFFLLFLSHHLPAQDVSPFGKGTFTDSLGRSIDYRILFPEDYDPDRTYPLVLFLHGAGERGSDNEKQLLHGVRTFLEPEHRARFPAIVLAPQCPAADYWASARVDRSSYPVRLDFDYEDLPATQALELALALTKNTIAGERVDPSRVYATGLSMGGMGTFEAVYREPALFAAAVPVCGAGDAPAYGSAQAAIPFWLFHGDEDGVVAVEESRRMYARLQELGATAKYTEYPGVNHNSWDKAYAEPGLLPWLFQQRKERP